MFEEVSFIVADGTVLRGRFYAAQPASVNSAVIVMAGGFSQTIDMRLAQTAEQFQKSGLSVLVYDHRGFGLSDGAVRQEVDPHQQINDWREAITFAVTLPGVDSDRVGIWGSSYSGGHVLVLGATDARVKCVVSQVPFVSGSETMARQVRSDFLVESRKAFAADRLGRLAGQAPMTLPVVVEDPTQPAVLPTRDTWEYTMRVRHEAATWRNEVTLRSLELSGAYEPGTYVGRITPRPLLMIIGTKDLLTPPDLALEVYSRAMEPKRLELLDCGHSDVYEGFFPEASAHATSWFLEHLG